MIPMKRFPLTALFLAVLALVAGTAATSARADQYLILAQGNGFSDNFVASVQAAGGVVVHKMDVIGVAVARSDDPSFVANASAIPEVQSVVPDVEMPITRGIDTSAAVSAPGSSPWGTGQPDLTSFQWAQQVIHANEARALGFTGLGVRVVVMDGSIMTGHPDLVDNLNVSLSKSFVEDEGVGFVPGGVSGNFSHATHVAGIIAAADNGFGTTGVAPHAEIVLAKVGRDATETIRSSAAIAALVYAAEIQAHVVNMSWGVRIPKSYGYPWPSGWFDPAWHSAAVMTALNRAANYAHQHGVTLVAAAGNAAWDWDHTADWYQVPRDLPHVIAVSATGPIGWALNPATDLDLPASYTDYGQKIIDLAAPGGNGGDLTKLNWDPCTVGGITLPCFVFDMVLSTSSRFAGVPEGPYECQGTWTWARGTSMAAPHVAGIAALVIEANGGSLPPDRVRTILERSADDLGKPGNDDYYGAGRVNALRAVLQK
jgi:subtilisin family serine protease